jgi:hypothetical protein
MSGKNVQIPYDLFLSIVHVFNAVEPEKLPENVKRSFAEAHAGVMMKRAALRNREAFTDVKQARNNDERERALNNYINTKKLLHTL